MVSIIGVSTELDEIDLAIISSLMKDGRKSFRQIAREIKVSTPTVEARFSKMNDLGVIKNIQPIIDVEKLNGTKVLTSLVFLKVNAARSIDIANKLSTIPEIKSIYLTTGEYNMIVKMTILQDESISYNIHQIEYLVRNKIATIKGLNSLTYQIVTKIMKDEQLSLSSLKVGTLVKASCDYCGNEITRSSRRLQVGQYSRYFCCGSCLTLYKDKYKGRIRILSK
jgi:DNA-binding Lrp family transcriptional regulator